MSPSLGSVRRECWTGFLGLPIRCVLGLPILGYGRWLYAVPLTMAEWCAPVSRCSCRLACMPFIPRPPYAAGCTMSVGFILAPPPYRMVNAGSCDYKKKKKKKKNFIISPCSYPPFLYLTLSMLTPLGFNSTISC